ncbi:dihydroorotase family protein [Oscillospiraceae bacterium OttesenSCG-928-G22]|nr:dihydroorotase family protein [Oscillospiraceae bacterium OttesenSCG-928-G22]
MSEREYDLLIENGQVYVEDRLVTADIGVSRGQIAAILHRHEGYIAPGAKQRYDAEGKVVLPGTIDPHVHIRVPGNEVREDFYTGTSAAAAGGVTTILEHPIAKPPQYSVEILESRIRAAEKDSIVDFAFYGAAGSQFPEEIRKLSASGKVVSFKTFLHESPEGRDGEFLGLTMANDAEQYRGFRVIGETRDICGVHAENNDMINDGIRACRERGETSGIDHARSRPPITEYETVSKLILFAEATGARIEFCHISTARAMEMLKDAKKRGLDIYVETCPHYLFLDESYLERYGAFAKCNPPLRGKEDVAALWRYVEDGTVDFIGSDHSPFTYDEKTRHKDDIFAAPAGMPSIEMRLPLLLNAVNKGRLSLSRMVELISENPAKIFGLYPKKGVILPGADADFAIVDLSEVWDVRIDDMFTKAKDIALVFDGMRLKGAVKATFSRGTLVFEDGAIPDGLRGRGEFLAPIRKNG